MCSWACVHARARASVYVRAFLCAVCARAWTQVDVAFARVREHEHACARSRKCVRACILVCCVCARGRRWMLHLRVSVSVSMCGVV